MNHAGIRISLALGLLALVVGTSPAPAETYIVEPITDSAATPADGQGFSQAELDQMLAPIALYPDALLSQVLIAATYPLEIVEAARWSRQNPQLSGEDAVAAVAEQGWDPSVTSLVAFPDLLARMDEDLEWTRKLGDAMLYQETQVMDSIQFLRARADATGTLESTEHVKVIREEKTIVIEPARTRIVHVPYYDPYVVYGTWWWPAYRPIVWAPPAYYYGYGGYPGFYWGSGIHISAGFFYSSFYWPQRSVVIINTPRYYHPPRYWNSRPYYKHYRNYAYTPGQKWKHNPVHRRGVAYRQPEVRDRYVRYSPGSKSVSTGTFSGGQRPSRDGAAHNRGGRDERNAGNNREWTRDNQRNAARGQVALPEDRNRTERTEQRFTQRDGTPRAGAPATNARPQQGARPDAGNLERRLGTTRGTDARGGQSRPDRGAVAARSRAPDGNSRPTVAGTTSRLSTQAVRPQANQRATAPTRTPQVRTPQVTRPQATQRATAPTRTPQVSRPQVTRPQATQRATTPSRPAPVARPPAAPRAAAPAPSRQASPPPAAPRAAPAPARRSDSGGSRRGDGGARDSRSGR
jgi:hypothetical protein